MSLLKDELSRCASGINLANSQKNTAYILCNYQNSLTLSFTSALLAQPIFYQYLSTTNLSIYQGQRSNIQKWTTSAKLGFLLGMCQGKSLKDWSRLFQLSESSIRKIYSDFGLSTRVQSRIVPAYSLDDWEKELYRQWFQKGVSIAEMSFRLLRSTKTIASILGIRPPQYFYQTPDHIPSYTQFLISKEQFHLSNISQALFMLAQGVDHQTSFSNGQFILRNTGTTLPIVLGAVLVEHCHEMILNSWTKINQRQSTPSEYRIYRLGRLFLGEDIRQIAKDTQCSVEQLQEYLSDDGLIFKEQNEIYTRAGYPMQSWEKELIRRWKNHLDNVELARRLQRPPSEINISERNHPSGFSIEYQGKIHLNELEKQNVCTKCRIKVISPPFDKCLTCLFQAQASQESFPALDLPAEDQLSQNKLDVAGE